METNPYEPPATFGGKADGPSVLRVAGQICVLIYGVLFTLLCVAGTILDIWSGTSFLETLFWLLMSVLMCYGVFALAIRQIRTPRLGPFWRYFACVLPILTYLGAAWEIHREPPMPPVEFVAALILFVVVTTPGLVFNWMLRHRLDRGRNSMA